MMKKTLTVLSLVLAQGAQAEMVRAIDMEHHFYPSEFIDFLKKLMKTVLGAVCLTLTAAGSWIAQAGSGMPICPEYRKAWTYDLADWMATIPGTNRMGRLTLPSSHDACMDENVMSYGRSTWSTQYYRLKTQMEYGARYFDVRIEKDHTVGHAKKFRAYHGDGLLAVYAYYLDEILDDAVSFVTAHTNETVILKFSHWDNDNDVWDALKEIYANSGWTDRFHKAPSGVAPPCLNEVTLSELRGKIVFLLDFTKDSITDEPVDARDSTVAKDKGYGPDRGVWRFADLRFDSPGYNGYYRVYDWYAGTDKMEDLESDQKTKWTSFDGAYQADGNAFMLCWQLTYRGNPRSNYKRAKEINPSLDLYIQNGMAGGRSRPRLVNFDYVDEHVCVPIVNLNAEFIEGLDLSVSYLEPLFDASGSVSCYETRRCEKKSCVEVTGNDALTMGNSWYVFRNSLSLTKGVSVSGDAKIILCDGANITVKSSDSGDAPGISVPSGSKLTIYAQTTESAMGALSAFGKGNDRAGIGCGKGADAGTVVINGGRISAEGTKYAAGIGGGHEGANGTVTINGGEVTAKSAEYGAGIGSGKRSHQKGHTPGAITINGGVVNASCGGGGKGAGIGGGEDCPGFNITINGGRVTATGGKYGAGIGGGDDGDGHDIVINGGYVTASGSDGAAGIGGGQAGDDDDGYGNGYSITIGGGTVIANGSADPSSGKGRSHDIGNGTRCNRSSSKIRITGGSVKVSSIGCTPKNAEDREVLKTTASGVEESPAAIAGLGTYGVRDLYPDSGSLYFYLPGGSYTFYSATKKFSGNAGDVIAGEAYNLVSVMAPVAVPGTTVELLVDGMPLPQDGVVESNSMVTVTWTVAQEASEAKMLFAAATAAQVTGKAKKYFKDGSETYTRTFTANKTMNVASEAVTPPEVPAEPKVQLGVVAQRYPWNGMLDVQYKTPYANASVTVAFKATIGAEVIELGTALGTGGEPATASFDLTKFDAFKDKQLKSVKITATIR